MKFTIPTEYQHYFIADDIKQFKKKKHKCTIMYRIMEYGSSDALAWLFNIYSKQEIKDFILKKGLRYLSNKSLSYYRVLLDISEDEWKQKSLLKSRNPFLKHYIKLK